MPDGAAHTRKPFALGRLLRHPCRFSELSHSIGIPYSLPLSPRQNKRLNALDNKKSQLQLSPVIVP